LIRIKNMSFESLKTFINRSQYSKVLHRYLASLIETNILKIMSFLYVILFYNLFVTIWYKDNKLIIYLFMSTKIWIIYTTIRNLKPG
jgi:hypothetical protein